MNDSVYLLAKVLKVTVAQIFCEIKDTYTIMKFHWPLMVKIRISDPKLIDNDPFWSLKM